MFTAFQSNAFQRNAFQINGSTASTGGGLIEKRIPDYLKHNVFRKRKYDKTIPEEMPQALREELAPPVTEPISQKDIEGKTLLLNLNQQYVNEVLRKRIAAIQEDEDEAFFILH